MELFRNSRNCERCQPTVESLHSEHVQTIDTAPGGSLVGVAAQAFCCHTCTVA